MSFFDRRARRGLPVAAGSGPTPDAIGALPVAEGTPVGVSAAAVPTVVTSAGQAVEAMVSTLSGHLVPVAGLPGPSVAVLRVSDRTLGIGNSRGLEAVGPFSAVELHGGRIEGVVQFQVWGVDSAAANTEMTALQGRLLTARAGLWEAGFVRLDGVAGTAAAADQGAWTRTADYQVLFEYQLEPTSAADSLIVSVPVDSAQDTAGPAATERTTVTGDLVRWDQNRAVPLVVRGPREIHALAVAAFLPSPPAVGVRMVRTGDGVSGPPNDYPTVAAFLAAVNDPVAPERNGQVAFDSVEAFVAAFDVTGDPLVLGDWDDDHNLDGYVVRQLTVGPPVPLRSAADRLEIVPQASRLDTVGVIYLRASHGLG